MRNAISPEDRDEGLEGIDNLEKAQKTYFQVLEEKLKKEG